VINKRLSVRETEKLVAAWSSQNDRIHSKSTPSADVRRLEEGLADWMACAVQLKTNGAGKGSVTIRFNNLDELDGVLARIGFPKEDL